MGSLEAYEDIAEEDFGHWIVDFLHIGSRDGIAQVSFDQSTRNIEPTVLKDSTAQLTPRGAHVQDVGLRRCHYTSTTKCDAASSVSTSSTTLPPSRRNAWSESSSTQASDRSTLIPSSLTD